MMLFFVAKFKKNAVIAMSSRCDTDLRIYQSAVCAISSRTNYLYKQDIVEKINTLYCV